MSVYAERVSSIKTYCPVCGNEEMILREVEYKLPFVGRVLIVSRHCSRCGYRRADLVPLDVRPRRRVYLRVDLDECLRAKVVRCGTASIEIPELGVSIEPGVDAPTYITNVEGLIARVVDALKSLEVLALTEEEKVRARQARELLESLSPSLSPLTIIIDDKAGLSAVINSRGALVAYESVEGELV